MRIHPIIALIVSCLVVVLSAQCQTSEVKAPEGFAVYENEGLTSREFKAITADGVRYRVRAVKNEPEGDEALWTQTLKKALEKKGYRIVKSTALRTDEGRSFQVVNSELSAGGHDYMYMTAFCVDGSRIILVEAAGLKDLMIMHEKNLQASVRALKTR